MDLSKAAMKVGKLVVVKDDWKVDSLVVWLALSLVVSRVEK